MNWWGWTGLYVLSVGIRMLTWPGGTKGDINALIDSLPVTAMYFVGVRLIQKAKSNCRE